MNSNYYAILMAGGIGSRFWPLSTSALPKQFHDILGTGETLIQTTYRRLEKMIPSENIFILTNEQYGGLVKAQLDGVKDHQILLEPLMRNTAPCILYASMKIKKINPKAVLVVAPSDHWIENETRFLEDLRLCFDHCQDNDVLMTLGIKPTFPNTGFGYIQYEKSDQPIKKVDQFREKPDYKTAKSFLAQGNFLWNAGIFVWNVQSVLDAFMKFQPEMYQQLERGYQLLNTDKEKEFIDRAYPELDKISIDYAVMERSENIYVLPANFDWNDLGTWGSLYEELQKDSQQNVVVGAQAKLENSHRNIIHTSREKVVVVRDLDDYIVIDRDDKLLIYPKAKEQEVKNVIDKLGNSQ